VGEVERLAVRGRRSLRLAWQAAGQGLVEFFRSDSLTFASSIAYYTLLSMFPFLWLVASLLGRIVVSEQSLLPVIQSALPRELTFLTDQLRSLAAAPLHLSLLVPTVWASMGVFGAITSAINHAWGVENPLGFFKHKLVAFVTMMASGGLLVATLGLMSAVKVVEATWFSGVLLQYPALEALSGIVYRNLPTPLFVLASGLIYYYVPNAKVRLRDVWVGALLAGGLWRAALSGYGWFMRNPQRLMDVHGSIGAVVLFLVWVYLSAVILLYGAEVTAAYARLRKRLPNEAPAAPERDATEEEEGSEEGSGLVLPDPRSGGSSSIVGRSIGGRSGPASSARS
jgi:membrane protein